MNEEIHWFCKSLGRSDRGSKKLAGQKQTFRQVTRSLN